MVSSTYSNPLNIPIDIFVKFSVFGVAISTIYGMAFGLIFAVLFEKLPSESSIVKGVILSVILFFIIRLTGDLIVGRGLIVDFVKLLKKMPLWILFGLMLGYFCNRFGP